jgi:hypothetical protein
MDSQILTKHKHLASTLSPPSILPVRDASEKEWTSPAYPDKNKKKKNPDHGDEDGDGDGDELGHVIRAKLLKLAVKRREEELKDLHEAYGEVLENKKPFDPPKGHGYRVLQAWVHSQDLYSYRDRLEKAIEKTEQSLMELEKRL